MYVMVVGDTHGNLESLLPKLYKAGDFKIQHVVVCGDFGLWTHKADGHYFLDEVQECARENELTVYAVGGNHENWDHWNWMVDNMPIHGWGMARRRVLLAPKVHSWKWAGKQFMCAGGAVSVDKEIRLAEEKPRGQYQIKTPDLGWVWYDTRNVRGAGSGPRTKYWPNETLTIEDLAYAKSLGKTNYLFTHDCSDFTPWKSRLKDDPASIEHRQKFIDPIIASAKPDLHFHGHMHQKYDWVNMESHGYVPFGSRDGIHRTRTLGLENDKEFNSWGVLHVETGDFFWPSEWYEDREARAERKAAHDAMRYAKSAK